MLFSFHCPSCNGKLEADASLSGNQADCPQCGKAVAIPEPRVDAGTTLAGFRLERRLGKGGMGEVFLARQLSVEREVAVKILPPGFAEDQDAVKRFLHEGKLAARLDHYNIVTVHEAGEDNGNLYLAMAYIDGESFDQRLKRGEVLPEAVALTTIRAVAAALAYAWDEFQLLHRDIKPANIMIDRRGRVFLMDLGLAKSLGEDSGMTLSGSILGTPQYMSPEQAQGLSDLGVQTDVYSLGATLYHLVTGSPPFTGDTTMKVLHMHLYEPLPPPRERNPQVTDACSHLIEVMMVKEPAGRYGDWRALIVDIDRVLQGAAPLADRPGSGASAVSAGVSKAELARQAQQVLARHHQPQQPKPTATPSAPGGTRRPLWVTIGIAAAAVVVLALIGGLVASRHGRDRTPPAEAAAERQTPDPTAAPASPQVAAGRRTAEPASPATFPRTTGEPTAEAVATPVVTPVPGPDPATKPAPRAAASPTPGQPWTVPDLGLELVWVAPGSFEMGSNDGEANEKPVHEVRISRGYWVGKYEVTQTEYEAIVGENPSHFKGARNPVEQVSWNDAGACCEKLTEQERAAGRLPTGYEYRLPSEAEWEYAARGGPASKGFTYAGSNSVDEVAWYTDDSGKTTHPVGEKQPNELGLYDMSGNVWESCLDRYDEEYYARSPQIDPVNLQAATRCVGRGGCWGSVLGFVRSAYRIMCRPEYRDRYLGLRVCLGPVMSTAGEPATAASAPTATAKPAAVVASPATAPVPEPAVPTPTVVAADLGSLAEPILAGRAAEVLRRWRDKADDLGQGVTDEQSQTVTAQLEALAGMNGRILTSLKADIGKTVTVHLAKETISCEVREVTATGVKVMQQIKRGRAGRTITLDQLSIQEKLTRLGKGDTPTLNLQRGMLAMEAEQPDIARKLFSKAGGPLGDALAAELDARQKTGREDGAKQAVVELLRQISTSPKLGDRDTVIAGIRKRCGGDPKRVQAAQKLLAEFEKEWGDSPAGKEWALVVRDALAMYYPTAGGDWTVPDLGLEMVWVKAMGIWVGKYEVTNAEYRAFRPNHDSKDHKGHSLNDARHPVVQVNFEDACAYATWLTEREAAAERLPANLRYRLPTEGEWLTVTQCGDGRTYPWGNRCPPKYGNYSGADNSLLAEEYRIDNYRDGFAVTCPVELSGRNDWGVYGLGGNVWEACAEDAGEQQSLGAFRGAAWCNTDFDGALRCDFRGTRTGPLLRAAFHGFRLVLAPAQAER